MITNPGKDSVSWLKRAAKNPEKRLESGYVFYIAKHATEN
jgi:hypothetical protein